MAKVLNLRERIHQPVRDTLIRTSGFVVGTLTDTTDLFLVTGKTEGETNLKTGATLANDSSMIILAARVLLWFRHSHARTFSAAGLPTNNGDYGNTVVGGGFAWPSGAGGLAQGVAAGDVYDAYRLFWQTAEGLFWTVGSGEKDSLRSMPSLYFPYGGNLSGDFGGNTDVLHWGNGAGTHQSILRLARAVTITPRQLIKVQVTGYAYTAGNNAVAFGLTTASGRNMMSPIHSLNSIDGIQKVVSMSLDGLISRDVQ